ncbi:hypothetical protein E3V33_06585 [Candidatus Marinimicrobia bacterium MT.SAG.4]|nr:hypothetical protein E3V33_06585 [Candidatus Marinimicrobia bacterium MT.SAG.4]
MATETFTAELLKIASSACGRGFSRKVSKVLESNEAALRETWQTILPTDLTKNDRNNLSTDTIFEIILSVSQEYLSGNSYDALLLAIAEVSIANNQFDRAMNLLEEIKSRPDSETNKSLKGSASRFLGEIFAKQANWSRALDEFNTAESYLRDSGDTKALSATLNTLGILYAETGKLSKALESFESSKKLAAANKDRGLLLKIFMNLGNILNIRGDHDGALEAYDSALKTLGNMNNDPLRALIHHNIGIAFKNKGDLAAAERKLNDGLKFSERAGDERIAGLSYLEKAEIYHQKNKIDESVLLATKAFKIFSEMKDRLGVAEVYKLMGMNHKKNGRFDLAEVYLGNSLRINERHDNALNKGETYLEIARLHTETKDPAQAEVDYGRALECFTSIEAQQKMAAVTKEMSATAL